MPLTIDPLVRVIALGVSFVVAVFLLVNRSPVIKLTELSEPFRNCGQWLDAPDLGLPRGRVESVVQSLLPLGEEVEAEGTEFLDVKDRV